MDGAAEQPGVLQHHAELVAQLVTGHRGDVHAVDRDLAALHVVEALEQVHQRGLAGAGGPDDGDLLTRLGSIDRLLISGWSAE